MHLLENLHDFDDFNLTWLLARLNTRRINDEMDFLQWRQRRLILDSRTPYTL